MAMIVAPNEPADDGYHIYETELTRYTLYTATPYDSLDPVYIKEQEHNDLEVPRIQAGHKALCDMSLLLWRQRKVLALENRGLPVEVVDDTRERIEKLWHQNMVVLVGKARRWVNETMPVNGEAGRSKYNSSTRF
ncbi:MAG: hypothetical protein Q9226_002463 [Calogaya cf. arnoldii]